MRLYEQTASNSCGSSLRKRSNYIYKLYEPCGDTAPKALKINSVSAGTVGYELYWGVKVNDRNIDLAYTYVDDGKNKNRKVNLANLASCPALDVSSSIFLFKQE